MANEVRFTCTTLPLDKKGVLPVDSDGYYTHPIGALNAANGCGEWYTYEGAKELFESSSMFMRRVGSGTLSGEMGHPKPLPNQSSDSYYQRFMTVEETNISHHFSEIWLDFDSIKDADGRPQITIMAKVKPMGSQGPALEGMLNNPKFNTCFSLRGVTMDKTIGGVCHRAIKTIVTFDAVGHSGLEKAKKYYSPALESISERTVTRDELAPMVAKKALGMAMESQRTFGLELFESLGWNIHEGNAPKWAKW
jgi:Peptidase S80 family